MSKVWVFVAILVGCAQVDETDDTTPSAVAEVVFIESGVQTVEVGWDYRVHSCYLADDGERCRDRTTEYGTTDGTVTVDAGEGAEGAYFVVVP